MTVSIIIPTYNRSQLIGATLNSIQQQTYGHWECIIVDDGSSDNTEQIVSQLVQTDSRFQFYKRPDDLPKGANACRNYGFSLSKGKLIQWFDSDDIMHPELLKNKVAIFSKTPETDFVICGMETIDSNGTIKQFHIPEVRNYLEGYLNDKLVINSLNILWKRTAVKDHDWDVGIHKYQDLDFIFRVLYKNTLTGARIDKSLITVKVHSDSISKTNNRQHNISRLQVRERMCILSNEVMTIELQKRLYRLFLAEFRNILSLGDYKLCFKTLQGKVIKGFSVKLNLLMHIFLHMLTKRGMVRLTNYILKVS